MPRGTRSCRTALPAGNRWIVLRATNRQGLVGADSVLVHVQSFLPLLQLTQPAAGSGFLPGDPITFHAAVSDRETPFAGLQVVWTSSIDGELSNGPPDATGVSTFTRSNLTRGAHLVRVVVTDGDGNSVRDSVLVHNDLPQAVNLLPIAAQAAGLLLHWDPVTEPEFSQFRIYRGTNQNGPFTLVGTLSDGSVTQVPRPDGDPRRDLLVSRGPLHDDRGREQEHGPERDRRRLRQRGARARGHDRRSGASVSLRHRPHQQHARVRESRFAQGDEDDVHRLEPDGPRHRQGGQASSTSRTSAAARSRSSISTPRRSPGT
jgi:hypothetical protein